MHMEIYILGVCMAFSKQLALYSRRARARQVFTFWWCGRDTCTYLHFTPCNTYNLLTCTENLIIKNKILVNIIHMKYAIVIIVYWIWNLIRLIKHTSSSHKTSTYSNRFVTHSQKRFNLFKKNYICTVYIG